MYIQSYMADVLPKLRKDIAAKVLLSNDVC